MFGGGPGDWDWQGLNHFAKKKEGFPNMVGRTLGSHYGQTPKLAELVLANVCH
jgi:acyl CoA:acetate/3-ketoacid CoA transferase